MDMLRRVENWAAPFVFVMTAVLLVWAVQQANRLGPLLAQPGKLNTFAEFFPVFIPSLTAMIGYWATLSLNMPDFTRFGRSQREQIVGQVIALPTTMAVFAAMGVLITSATVVIYGEAIGIRSSSSPGSTRRSSSPSRCSRPSSRRSPSTSRPTSSRRPTTSPTHFRGSSTSRLAGSSRDCWPFSCSRGTCSPIPRGYIFTWLLGYSGGLGSIAGVLIADYWIVRRTAVALEDLDLTDGRYRYASGWNGKAVVATLVGCALAWGGLVVPALQPALRLRLVCRVRGGVRRQCSVMGRRAASDSGEN